VRAHGGLVWTLDGKLLADLLDPRPWQVPDLLLEAEAMAPPQSSQAEEAVLGSILKNGLAIADVATAALISRGPSAGGTLRASRSARYPKVTALPQSPAAT
jgi:hypothetical protein